MKVFFFKTRDSIRRWLGKILFDKKITGAEDNTLTRIVFVRWDAKIGDSYIFSSMYNQIKSNLKNSVVIVLAANSAHEIHKKMSGIDLLIPITKRPSYSKIKAISQEIKYADIIIHMTENMKLKDLYLLSLLKPKLVYSLDDNLKIVNRKMSSLTKNLLFSEKLNFILKDLGINITRGSIQISITTKNPDLKNKILLNPFGSNASKTINIENTKRLITTLTKKYNVDIYLMSSPNTKKVAEKIAREIPSAKVVKNILTIQDAINAISSCDLIISVDTSLVHIAHSLEKKLIAIYPKKNTGEFNMWEVALNAKTKIIYSPYSGVNPDLNNFNADDVIQAIEDISNKKNNQ